MFEVTGRQNALLCSATMFSACSRVTFVNSTEMRREVKSGSKITVSPASLLTASKTALASFVAFMLIGAREMGSSCGGPAINFGWSLAGEEVSEFSAAPCLAASRSIVALTSCAATALEGSIIRAFRNSPRASSRLDWSRSRCPCSRCHVDASKRALAAFSLNSVLFGSARSALL